MKVRWIKVDESVGAERGDVVVCIPVYGGHELFVQCLDSILAHTPTGVPILVCDDASPDARTFAHVRQLEGRAGDHALLYLRRDHNVGFPANVNGALGAAAPADVVVINSDCVVAAGWLEDLRAAAHDSARVATATTLTNHGTIVSVPNLRRPGPVPAAPWSLDRAAASVRRRSRRLRPRLPTAIGHCMYIRRSALELVGDFDTAFAPGYGEEVDFSQRCLLSGMVHVLADDVLVAHHGGASFALNADRARIQDAHEQLIAERYPYYHDSLRALEQTDGPLSRALGVARRALIGTAVTIDLRGAPVNGADDAAILALLRALGEARDGDDAGGSRLRLAALASSALRRGLDVAAVPGLILLGDLDAARAHGADVVHRLYPVSGAEEWAELAGLGERVIITQADLCAFSNPADFPEFAEWEAHRARTREVMALADGIVFLSPDARADALAEGLVTPDRASAVDPGVDHLAPRHVATRAPQELNETIVCLAPASHHGSRMFALRVVAELQRRHQWNGRLVLAGREVKHGSSSAEERRYLAENPQLARATVVLPAPDHAERARLLAGAALVLDPVICGGPIVPVAFAAADHGVPCLSAPAEISADRVWELLRQASQREHNLDATRRAAAQRTWRAGAEALLGVYDQVSSMPAAGAGRPASEPSRAASEATGRGKGLVSHALRRAQRRRAAK